MKDILDEILDKLPPSTIEKISQFNYNNSRYNSENLDKIIAQIQELKIGQVTTELQRKSLHLQQKTKNNSDILAKLMKEMQISVSLNRNVEYKKNLQVLEEKLLQYDNQITELRRNLGNINCMNLFKDIENTNEEIRTLEKKIVEAKNKYQYFDDFPPNIEEAKKAIEEVKDRLKYNEQCHNLL